MSSLLTQAIPLLVAGMVGSAAYLAAYTRKHGVDTYETAVGQLLSVFPTSAAVVGGAKVIYFSFDSSVCNISLVDQASVCLGGLVLMVASGFDVYRKIKQV